MGARRGRIKRCTTWWYFQRRSSTTLEAVQKTIKPRHLLLVIEGPSQRGKTLCAMILVAEGLALEWTCDGWPEPDMS